MKKKLLIIILLFTTAFAHAQWEVQLDLQNETYLDRIFFLDENYGWTIGGATIGSASPYLYTTDGGQNWFWSNSGIEGTDIVFVNPDTGFISSCDGIIYKTINGGQTWTSIQTPTTQSVMRLFFVNENNGWATLNNFNDSSQIIHTTNGGNTWYPQQVFEINTSSILPIFFLNDSVGYGGGGYYDIENDDSYSSIVKTKDKGETWENIYLSQNTFYLIYDIYFRDTVIGWAVGTKGTTNSYLILNTEDGGETWEEITLPELQGGWYEEASIIYSIQFVNDTIGWLTCADNDNWGYIFLTTDSGENWQQQFTNLWQPICDIQMLNQDTGWAVGGDFIYFTDNGTYNPVGVEEKQNSDFNFAASPNPTNTGEVLLEMENTGLFGNLELKVFDVLGNEVHTQKVWPHQGATLLDVNAWARGIYVAAIFSHSEMKGKCKIVVE